MSTNVTSCYLIFIKIKNKGAIFPQLIPYKLACIFLYLLSCRLLTSRMINYDDLKNVKWCLFTLAAAGVKSSQEEKFKMAERVMDLSNLI